MHQRRPPRAHLLLAAGLVVASSTACSATRSATGSTAGPASAPASTATSASTAATTSSPSGGAPTTAPASPSTTSAATAASSASASTDPAGAAASPAPCRTSDLHVVLDGRQGEGAGMSQDRVFLQFTNTGTATCTLDGHPGVSYVAGGDGHQVGAGARHDGTPALVTLAPGQTAHADLDIVTAQAFPEACGYTPTRGLRVYPPDQKTSAYVAAPGTGCSSTSTSYDVLTIGPVQPGATGS